MAEDKSINPYEATESVAEEDRVPIEKSEINYPGGLRAVLLTGLACGGVTGVWFAGGAAGTIPEGVIVLPILLWFGAFIGLGLVLPGSPSRRVTRAIVSGLLGVAALILYVPVCGFTLVFVEGTNTGLGFSWIVSSVVAFTSVLFLGALIIRRTARISHYVVPNRRTVKKDQMDSAVWFPVADPIASGQVNGDAEFGNAETSDDRENADSSTKEDVDE